MWGAQQVPTRGPTSRSRAFPPGFHRGPEAPWESPRPRPHPSGDASWEAPAVACHQRPRPTLHAPLSGALVSRLTRAWSALGAAGALINPPSPPQLASGGPLSPLPCCTWSKARDRACRSPGAVAQVCPKLGAGLGLGWPPSVVPRRPHGGSRLAPMLGVESCWRRPRRLPRDLSGLAPRTGRARCGQDAQRLPAREGQRALVGPSIALPRAWGAAWSARPGACGRAFQLPMDPASRRRRAQPKCEARADVP